MELLLPEFNWIFATLDAPVTGVDTVNAEWQLRFRVANKVMGVARILMRRNFTKILIEIQGIVCHRTTSLSCSSVRKSDKIICTRQLLTRKERL